MLTFFQAVILGIVEGVTEFLPISSTAHLILVSHALGLATSDFLKSFEIIIQLGSVLAVVVLYWKKFFDWRVLSRLIIAFIPTGIIGLIVYKFAKAVLLENLSIVLWALFLGGLFLIIFEMWYRESSSGISDIQTIGFGQCLLIGIFQAIAIVPGVSRSAATIVGGMLVGIKRRTIVEFSFLLAVPTMLAATALDIWKSSSTILAGDVTMLVVGFIVAFASALAVISWFIAYIQRHNFRIFGWYRIILAVAVYFL